MAIQAPERRPQVRPYRAPEPAEPMGNVGGGERTARLLGGMVLIVLGYAAGPAWLSALLYALGIAALLTALAQYCPLNALIGRNTYYRSGMR